MYHRHALLLQRQYTLASTSTITISLASTLHIRFGINLNIHFLSLLSLLPTTTYPIYSYHSLRSKLTSLLKHPILQKQENMKHEYKSKILWTTF
jgi:hypothetical protein